MQSARSVPTVSRWNGRSRPTGEADGVGRAGLREGAEVAGRVVVEAPHAGIGPVVVVERPVLHHQEDHVLDRPEVRAGRRTAADLATVEAEGACPQAAPMTPTPVAAPAASSCRRLILGDRRSDW